MPTFLTEPEWYDKNGALITPEKVKVNNAVNADEAERATDYFGKKYQCPDWMKSHKWIDANDDEMAVGSLLLSGNEIQMNGDDKSDTYLEVLPAELYYTHLYSETGHLTVVNLGNDKRKFGKMYAESFEGTATNTKSVMIGKAQYEFSIDDATLTLTKKTT